MSLFAKIKLVAELIFKLVFVNYLVVAFVGAGWVLGDVFESEGWGRELGILLALFIPVIFLYVYGKRFLAKSQKIK